MSLRPHQPYERKGMDLIKQAIDADEKRDYMTAFRCYKAGLAELFQALKLVTNQKTRKRIRSHISDYLSRVEIVKGFLDKAGLRRSSTKPSVSGARRSSQKSQPPQAAPSKPPTAAPSASSKEDDLFPGVPSTSLFPEVPKSRPGRRRKRSSQGGQDFPPANDAPGPAIPPGDAPADDTGSIASKGKAPQSQPSHPPPSFEADPPGAGDTGATPTPTPASAPPADDTPGVPSAPPPDTVAADEEDELAGLSALDSLPPTPATLPGVNADSSSAAAGSSDSHEVQLNPVVSPPDRAQEEQADTPPQVTRQGSFSVLQVGDSLLGGRGSLLNIPKRRSPSASSIASLQAFDANDLDDVPEDSVSTSSPLEDDEHKGKPKPRPMKETLRKISWKKGALIGKGAFGKVYEGLNTTTGELIAIKQITLRDDEQKKAAKNMLREVDAMAGLQHDNIVNLLDVQRSDNALYLLMEFVPGKSIKDMLDKFGAFSEEMIRLYTRQLVNALIYIHKANIIHRDLKAQNLLVDVKGCVKLADFGSCKLTSSSGTSEVAQEPSLSYAYTPLWVAPEVLKDVYTSKIDIWSLGCVVIEMATGDSPWAEKNFKSPFEAMYHIGSSTEIPKIPDWLSPAAKDFMLLCLQRDPNERASAEQLATHEWLLSASDTSSFSKAATIS